MAALGSVLMQMARFAEAEPLFAEALAIDRKSARATPHELACALENLANCARYQQRFEAALLLYAEAAEVLGKNGGGPTEDLPLVLEGWGGTELAMGRTEAAEKHGFEPACLDEPRREDIVCSKAANDIGLRQQIAETA